MPTYDYECDACGEKFEKFQSIKAPSIRKCPSCGKLAVRRLIGTGAGIIFKGSGFYQTDYRSESYRKGAESDKAPAADKAGGEKADGDKSSGGDKSGGVDKSAGDGKASSDTSTAQASSESASSKPSGAAEKADKAGKSEKARSKGRSK